MSKESSAKPFQHEPTTQELMEFAVRRGLESYSAKSILDMWHLCGTTEIVAVVNGVTLDEDDAKQCGSVGIKGYA